MSEDIKEVEVESKRVSLVIFLIPLLALIIGGWLLYSYYSKIGPLVTITFKSSGGLEPTVSPVKFRDVKVGVVERVELLKKSEGVKVYVRIHKDAEPFLNKSTKFWIVKPEIGLGKIKGLDALMSGAYIQMYAVYGKELKKSFIGFDDTPNDLEKIDGNIYELVANQSYDLRSGSTVYYKGAVAGVIKSVSVSSDGKNVKIYLFIKKDYTKFINSTTRFYATKNFSIKMADYGINVDMASLSKILFDGVEFYTKNLSKKDSKRVKNFYLYQNRDEATRKKLGLKREKFVDFKLKFQKGVGYLSVGSTVKLDGFKVGEVKDIVSYYDPQKSKVISYVIASIDISAFENDKLRAFDGLKLAVNKGLRARLDEVNPLINSLYINLVKTDKSATLIKGGKYYIFPTTTSTIKSLSNQIDSLVSKFSNIDINSVIKNLNKTLLSIKKLSSSYDKDSNFADQLSQTLKDVDKSSKELKKVLEKVNKKPNSLIFGD